MEIAILTFIIGFALMVSWLFCVGIDESKQAITALACSMLAFYGASIVALAFTAGTAWGFLALAAMHGTAAGGIPRDKDGFAGPFATYLSFQGWVMLVISFAIWWMN